MKTLLSCALLCGAAIAQQTTSAQGTSAVSVEPWKTLVRETVTVNAGRAQEYNFPLEAGTKLTALFHVEGGIDNSIQIFLLDSANYQLYTAHREFLTHPGTTGVVRSIGKYDFLIPRDDVYYLLVDNGHALLLPRQVTIHVDAILPHSTPDSEKAREAFQGLYSRLKQTFVFPDFHTSIRHCGVENAFSTPDITICVELLEELQSSNGAAVTAFVYLHELGHTLMKEWGLPMWDNEDDADEFATALLLMMKQKGMALEAAQWWASQGATPRDAVAKIWINDRHSLSPQRARNIIGWVNNASDIVPRWERVFVPNMQTPALQNMLHEVSASDRDIVAAELSRRGLQH